MAADFVLPDYRWLRSPDGKESARVLFKAGKARDGYFTNAEIMEQVKKAMDILEKYYPDVDHLLVYDNTTTHRKHAPDALSARKLLKKVDKEGKLWGILSTVVGDNGKPICGPDGKVLRQTVWMANRFFNGRLQSLHFPEGHQHAGLFKGMWQILIEHGLTKEADLNAECKAFKCPPDATACCYRRVLYNQPNFEAVASVLETMCKAHGFQVLFLPKFHPEISMVESCWGYSKRVYRVYPLSSSESTLEINVMRALEAVSVKSMRRYIPI
jgi:hypothetical protein